MSDDYFAGMRRVNARTHRLVGDPPGVRSRSDLDACTRMLKRIEQQRPQALIVLTLDDVNQRALRTLTAAGFVRNVPGRSWNHLAITELGTLYLHQPSP